MLRWMCAMGVLLGGSTALACDPPHPALSRSTGRGSDVQVQVVAPAAVVSPFAIVSQVLTAPVVVAADGCHSTAVAVTAAAPVMIDRRRPIVVRSRTVVRGAVLSRVLRR